MVPWLVLITCIQAGPPAGVDPKTLEALVEKVTAIGQRRPLDPNVLAFLEFKEKSAVWHSRLESDRDIQWFEDKKKRFLLFTVPEKPFPEFGRIWLYLVNIEGKVVRAGVREPMQKYAPLSDKEAIKNGARAEIEYWAKLLLADAPLSPTAFR